MGKKGAPAGKAASPTPEEPEDPVEEERPPAEPGELLEGDFVFADGATYEGQYLKVNGDLVLHGQGLLCSGPESFEGTFDHGLYKEGRFASGSGAVYVGCFQENQFHGHGEYTWPDGRIYRGMWRDGNMHGPGEYLKFLLGGAQQVVPGFSLAGVFDTSQGNDARSAFLADYVKEVAASASAALRAMAERSGTARPPRQFLCPSPEPPPSPAPSPPPAPADGEEQPPETEQQEQEPAKPVEEPADVIEDRVAVNQALVGPFPDPALVTRDLAQAFVAGLAEGAAAPVETRVYEDVDLLGQRVERQRLKLPQLRYAGQAAEFSLVRGDGATGDELQPGTLLAVVLVNVSKETSLTKPRWKIAHVDAIPPAPPPA